MAGKKKNKTTKTWPVVKDTSKTASSQSSEEITTKKLEELLKKKLKEGAVTKKKIKLPRNAKLKKQVREAIDYDRFKHYCQLSIEELMTLGEPSGDQGYQHCFIDNGSDILAVAHCDFVAMENHFDVAHVTHDTWVFSPRLDDRQGVYTILDLLPKLGITCDVLLTENEEIGQSTAKDFRSAKDYKWIVEFDRMGDDVVTYNFNNADLDDALEECFKEVGWGSFTDIVELEWMGVCGFNVAVGYEDNHSWRAYASMNTYIAQIARFLKFHNKYKNTQFPHTPMPKPSLYGGGYTEYGYGTSYSRSVPYAERNYGVCAADTGATEQEREDGLWFDCDSCGSMFCEGDTMCDQQGRVLCPYCGIPHTAEDSLDKDEIPF